MSASERIAALYESTPKAALRQVLVIEYRCPAGCLLMHAWRTPEGVLWYRPRNTLSRQTAANELVDAARIKRTSDGERKWCSTGGSLDELLEFFGGDPTEGGLSLNCHHLRNVTVLCERLAADGTADPGHPTRATITP